MYKFKRMVFCTLLTAAAIFTASAVNAEETTAAPIPEEETSEWDSWAFPSTQIDNFSVSLQDDSIFLIRDSVLYWQNEDHSEKELADSVLEQELIASQDTVYFVIEENDSYVISAFDASIQQTETITKLPVIHTDAAIEQDAKNEIHFIAANQSALLFSYGPQWHSNLCFIDLENGTTTLLLENKQLYPEFKLSGSILLSFNEWYGIQPCEIFYTNLETLETCTLTETGKGGIINDDMIYYIEQPYQETAILNCYDCKQQKVTMQKTLTSEHWSEKNNCFIENAPEQGILTKSGIVDIPKNAEPFSYQANIYYIDSTNADWSIYLITDTNAPKKAADIVFPTDGAYEWITAAEQNEQISLYVRLIDAAEPYYAKAVFSPEQSVCTFQPIND